MPKLSDAVDEVRAAQKASRKPLAVVLAGHNGSGKSTLWYERLAPHLRIPLINADRMMLSILPEPDRDLLPHRLPTWAQDLRDTDTSWMQVAQQGVQAFVAHAMTAGVPFAMETVFSHWVSNGDGTFASKIDRIKEMQAAGYFVLLVFVGLSSSGLSIARVDTRVKSGGHAVPLAKLVSRFPKTQAAIRQAAAVADATILTDNSRELKDAFYVCRVQLQSSEVYDRRRARVPTPPAIRAWLDVVSPLS